MLKYLFSVFFLIASLVSIPSIAVEVTGTAGNPYNKIKEEAARCKFNNECGWWFGFIDKEKEKEDEDKTPPPMDTVKPTEQQKKEHCSKSETWEEGCGFVDPGDDYEFMVVQRDKLSQVALMKSEDMESVRQFQKFMLWAVDSAITYTKTWEYNMVQDQTLNPFARHPVTSFGLRAAVRGKDKNFDDIFNEINAQNGQLVFFTRSDCSYCIDQEKTIKLLAAQTELKVSNVSLDEECLEGYSGEECEVASPDVLLAAQALGVAVVPDLFLLLPAKDGSDAGWIRVSTGMESVTNIKRRIKMFFDGVKSASIKGLNKAANSYANNKRPDVTFDPKYSDNYVPGTTLINSPKPSSQGSK